MYQIQIFQILKNLNFSDFQIHILQIFSDSENLNLHHYLYVNIQIQIFQIFLESEIPVFSDSDFQIFQILKI